ncbi:hypothetical protein WN944_011645 [Citrus x changshan-huyou]|uniref:Protein kinase domain-containing protein n=2 Tax=Citrus TaxID=2706 RepID=A0ACB8NB17_CITSI|nr:protein kinase domain-containing protein [Citrus sinensis]
MDLSQISDSPLTSFCMFILCLLLARTVSGKIDPQYLACVTKTCGDGQNISFPFYIENQQEAYCGYPGFNLSCNDKGNPVLKLSSDTNYIVEKIVYHNHSVLVSNAAFSETNSDAACTFPRIKNVSLPADFQLAPDQKQAVLLYNCNSSSPEKLLRHKLLAGNCSGDDTVLGMFEDDSDLDSASKQCKESAVTPVAVDMNGEGMGDHIGIEEMVRKGFLLKWKASDCRVCKESGGRCGFDADTFHFQCYCPDMSHAKLCTASGDGKLKSKAKVALVIGVPVSAICVILIIIAVKKKVSSDNSVIFWKKKTYNYRNIEAFLRNYGSLAPKRYRYADIKKMTNSFKNKLGQGGYGGVYKGKLLDGQNVAIKVLNETKGNGEDFINEVASISRTSHVNIVTLLGFCFEGHRRALIYEFVSNGSLEKFIHEKHPLETNQKLKWEVLYKIAVGIARGLEYLHRGCNTRILHFDIKPHNILLDEDFCPKISDFGLAKICEGRESIVSMTGARGTIGYIAPEVFCRNFGEVSYKSDVYSYGMMVFEMTGEKNNANVAVDRSSEIYFPHWVYKRLELEEDLGLQGIENEEDKEYARKMILVSLWCIQTNPSDRPSMNRVVEMLEGSLDSLQIPPRPFLLSSGSQPDFSSILVRQTESSMATC